MSQMRKALAAKSRERSEEDILDQGIRQLLRATKDEAQKRGQPLNREQLRKEGFSKHFIDQVEQA